MSATARAPAAPESVRTGYSAEAIRHDFRDNAEWRRVKRAAKARLADAIRARTGGVVDPDSMFDVQVKRIHE